MPLRMHLRSYLLAVTCVLLFGACGESPPGDGARQSVIKLSDEPTLFVAPTGEEITFPAVPSDYDAEVAVSLTRAGSQGMPAEAQLLTRAVTLTFRNLAELPDGATVALDLPLLGSASLRVQGGTSNLYVLVSGVDRATAINQQDWQYLGDLSTTNDRSVLTVTKEGLDAIASSLDERGNTNPTLDNRAIGLQLAANIPGLFKPAEEGLYRVDLDSAYAPSVQDAATDPLEYCETHHGHLVSKVPYRASPTGQEQRVAILMVHGYQSIGIPLGDNLSKSAHCNVWLNTMAAFKHQAGDWQTLRNQSDLYVVRYDSDDRVMLNGSKVRYYLDQLSHQLGYQDVVILAHSMGGVVAVEARRQAGYPEAVKGIVTLGTPHMGAPMRCSFARAGVCLGWQYLPGMLGDVTWLFTSGISLIAPSDGGLDLTFAYSDRSPTTVANPYLVNLWLESRNTENVHAIYGSNEFPTFDTGHGPAAGETLYGLDVGYHDRFIPASSAAGSPTLKKDGKPYPSMFSRVTGVGRDHGQLHAGCNGCSDGRTSQDAYDPYFDTIADALLEFVPVYELPPDPTSGLGAVLAGGAFFSLAITSDGSLWGWGAASLGQLGKPDAAVTWQPPMRIELPAHAVVVSSAPTSRRSAVVLDDGTVRSFGPLFVVSDEGLVGYWTGGSEVREVLGLSDVQSMAVGIGHNLAVHRDGTVSTWSNRYEDRDGSSFVARPIEGLSNIVAVATGKSFDLALRGDGTVMAWGSNYHGQLGDGTTVHRDHPERVHGLAGAVSIAAGNAFAIALLSDGTLMTWGEGWLGQLGTGATSKSLTPQRVPALGGVVAVAAGANHALALRADGTLFAWGTNFDGELGSGSLMPTQSSVPVLVDGIDSVTAIAAGGHEGVDSMDGHSIAVKEDGTIWAWGSNFRGELGREPGPSTPTPIQVHLPTW